MEKRLIIAVVLSILIVMSFQFLVGKQPPQPQVVPQAQQTTLPDGKNVLPAIQEPAPTYTENEFSAETDKYKIVFSNIGGSVKNITLKDYKSTHSEGSLELVDVKNPPEYLFAVNLAGEASPTDISNYSITKKDDGVSYYIQAKNFAITKEYVLSKSKYGIELRLFIKNISDGPRTLDYSIIAGSGIKPEKGEDKRMLEVSSKLNGKIGGLKRPKEGKIITPGTVSWIATKNKYFSVILKPFVMTKNEFCVIDKEGQAVVGVNPESITIQPGSTVENRYIIYAGPGNIPILKNFGYELEETVNYGFFGGIAKVLLVVMMAIQKVISSWGITIILLSIFLNLITFPLTAKSFKSMQKMQELHPQMEKLKVQHKNDPQKLNKEIMDLYKKYKINPLSGCLPMLLQMPIFIALYQALMKSIELRGANFLWIKDLSMPDAVRIPFELPLIGNSINILPLVMVGAMVAQQKISTKTMGSAVTEEQKQQQKMMLIVMPIVFGFIFYNMPSGLVLYWVTNTILTMVEQAAILKKA